MELQRRDGIGILLIDGPNTNAIDQDFIDDMNSLLHAAEADTSLRALVITSAHPKIFCPGLNLKALVGLPYERLFEFAGNLTGMVRNEFSFSKPQIAAINGHAIAGGCLVAMGADYRFMARGKSRIGVLEIDVALPVALGGMAVLEYVMGRRNVEKAIYSGELYLPEDALNIGMVDELVEPEELLDRAVEKAKFLGSKPAAAFKRDKQYLRAAVIDWIDVREARHLKEWVDCWYSKEAQEALGKVVEQLGTK
ncbi:MAG: enoyl-CoA hydratase/isomerase family protein [Dehalococcoidia bacterium]|nr:enoyl-CoA hydratase/isomerase family protein [Dehalococcoidia bacterium]